MTNSWGVGCRMLATSCFVLDEPILEQVESCGWNGEDAGSSVVKNVSVVHLDLHGRCGCDDVFVQIAFFDSRGKVGGPRH